MATDKQIAANRRNAQDSTGPRTPEGKAASSRNRLTHGLLARDAVLPPLEDPAAFEDLLAAFLARFSPADAFEESLVRELATAEWRLRRLTRLETGLFTLELDRAPQLTAEQAQYDEDTGFIARAFRNDCGGEAFAKLIRYENSIRRAFYKALDQLNRRPPRPAPPPAQTNPISPIPLQFQPPAEPQDVPPAALRPAAPLAPPRNAARRRLYSRELPHDPSNSQITLRKSDRIIRECLRFLPSFASLRARSAWPPLRSPGIRAHRRRSRP